METRPNKVTSVPATRTVPAVEIRSGEATFEPPFPGRGQTCPRASHEGEVRHRRESSRTEPSLNLGRRSRATSNRETRAAKAATSQCANEHPREIWNPTLRRAWPRDLPGAAICVQDVDVQCVLQFTLIHAAGCALHRHTSRVIHRLELSVTARSSDEFVPERREAQEAGESRSPHPFDRGNSKW